MKFLTSPHICVVRHEEDAESDQEDNGIIVIDIMTENPSCLFSKNTQLRQMLLPFFKGKPTLIKRKALTYDDKVNLQSAPSSEERKKRISFA